jgi:predicted NBD/HSP70 family sugar kinase
MQKVSNLWLQRVLQTLLQKRTATRADIRRATRLNVASISQTLQLLLSNGTILKVGELGSDIGRRPEVFMLHPDAAYFIGLDLEGHRISFALTSFGGDVRCRYEEDLAPGQSLDIQKVFDGIEHLIQTLDPEQASRVIAAGISYPGFMNKQGQLSAVNLGWHQFPFVSSLKQAAEARKFSDLPIFIESDRQSCVQAEQWLGAAKGYRNGVYVSAERGIGVGIFLEDKVIDVSGELGHLTIDVSSTVRCKCGKRGCLETVALSDSIVRQYVEQAQGGNGGGGRIRFADVLEKARQGDGPALSTMKRAAAAWGLALSHVVNLLNPEIIILGGDLVAAEDVLLPLIKKEIARQCPAEWSKDVRITVSSLGLDIRLRAAASLAFRKALDDPTLLKKICHPVLAGASKVRRPKSTSVVPGAIG